MKTEPFVTRHGAHALLVATLATAALAPCAAAQEAIVAVKAGKLITISGPVLENAVVLIEGGKIKTVGKAGEVEVPWNARVIDASDKTVMPTWVLAHTSGGLQRANESMANVPFITVEDGLNPVSPFFEEALRNGIGTIQVMPGNDTLIGGSGVVVRPYGKIVDDMIVRTSGAMKLSLQGGNQSRMAQIAKLRRAFQDVDDWHKDWERRKKEFEQEKAVGATGDKKEFDEPLDPQKKPVIELLQGKRSAFVWVPDAGAVPEALRLTTSYSFPMVLVLGPGCWRAVKALTRLQRPVVLEGEVEVFETDPDTGKEKLVCPAAVLAQHGIPFALSLAEEGGAQGPGRYPWWQMASAIRNGVDRATALRSMTLVPARVLGLEDQVGSIEPGKLGNLQVLTGDPLDATTWVDTVLLEGDVVYERSKDQRLQHLFGKDRTAAAAK